MKIRERNRVNSVRHLHSLSRPVLNQCSRLAASTKHVGVIMLCAFDGPQSRRRCYRFALVRYGNRFRSLAFTACDGCLMTKEQALAKLWELQAGMYSMSMASIKRAVKRHRDVSPKIFRVFGMSKDRRKKNGR